jgi:hypothetical protein
MSSLVQRYSLIHSNPDLSHEDIVEVSCPNYLLGASSSRGMWYGVQVRGSERLGSLPLRARPSGCADKAFVASSFHSFVCSLSFFVDEASHPKNIHMH